MNRIVSYVIHGISLISLYAVHLFIALQSRMTYISKSVPLVIVGIVLFGSLPSSLGFGNIRNIDPVIKQKIDDFIEQVYFPVAEISSLALAIVKDDGELLYTTGFGYADQEKRIPNGNQTQFCIGSITKSFTSAALVKTFADQFPQLGEAALDTPLQQLLPQANLTFIDRFRSEHLTFRDLVAHRACTFRHDLPLSGEPFETSEELTYRTRYAEEICGARTEFQYNNVLYTLAGQLLGDLVGKTYDEVLQDLLTELGMLDSALMQKTDDFTQMPFRARPYYVLDKVSYPMNLELMNRIVPYNPAGGIFATPDDMAKYMRFHLNRGSLDGKQVIPEKAMSWITKPAIMLPGQTYRKSDEVIVINRQAYGLGLILATYNGWPYLQHSGFFTPYASLLSLFPDQKLGIFTSTNQGPALWSDLVVHSVIVEILQGNPDAAAKAQATFERLKEERELDNIKKEQVVKNIFHKGPKNNADDIVGKYGSGAAGDLEIYEKWNNGTNEPGLYLAYGKWMLGWLENVGDNYYKITWDTDILQELIATGSTDGVTYIQIQDGVVDFVLPQADGTVLSAGRFTLGVSLDKLPPIPWNPGSCGPEN